MTFKSIKVAFLILPLFAFSSLGGDFELVIGNKIDSCFKNQVIGSSVHYTTPEELSMFFEMFFQGKIDAYKGDLTPHDVFLCIGTGHRVFCSIKARKQLNNYLIKILKWKDIKNEINFYGLFSSLASTLLSTKLKNELKSDLSLFEREHIQKASLMVDESLKAYFKQNIK